MSRYLETKRERDLAAMLVRCRDGMVNVVEQGATDGEAAEDLWSAAEAVDLLLSEHMLDAIRPPVRRLADLQGMSVEADSILARGGLA